MKFSKPIFIHISLFIFVIGLIFINAFWMFKMQAKGHDGFEVIYITDKSCAECYDPLLHRQALDQLSMTPLSEKFIDISEGKGKKLIKKYTIETAPTILLKGDLAKYPQFTEVWPTVGTIESDGTYVFRAGQQFMGAYRDIKTGEVIKTETEK